MNLERRYLIQPGQDVQLESRAENEPPAIIGYGAVYYDGTANTEYQIFSDMVERIMPGAFDRALKEDDVRALFNHDPNIILGRMASGSLKLTSDKRGLHYDITLPDTAAARDLLSLLKRGDVTGSSFSFRADKETWIGERRGDVMVEVRQVEAVRLYDVGPVTFPAYQATEAGLRSEERAALQSQIEQIRRGRFDPIEAGSRGRRLMLADHE